MKLTFVDAGVLIAAATGKPNLAKLAMQILDDAERCFSSSTFVKLETLPKAIYYKREAERKFYDTFFGAVVQWAAVDEKLTGAALAEASHCGLNACDALHIAAAIGTKSAELITTEKPTTAIHRTQSVVVKTIHP